MKFSELNLDSSLQSAIEQTGFADCTPIQEQAIPHIIEGKDVAGLAQTGTGKTAAFLIPLMERILRARPQPPDQSEELKAVIEKRAFKDWKPQNFILILVPTRELAEQVQENALKFGAHAGLKGVAVYGGTAYEKQKEAFKNGVDFVAATPGRLIDLYKENFVDLKQVRAVVFDEADRMFDMGFKDDMKYILQRIPRERQFLVFSATLNFEVLNTAYQFGAEPIEFNVSRDQARAENVKDEIFHVGQEEKPMHLLSLLKLENPKQAIIFTNFKHNVDRVAKFLNDNGVPAMGISSLLTQAQRTRVMDMFKAENDKNVLVATDVAARGLDIKGVDLVVNFELPNDSESYVHRIGRTGRAGAEGKAFSLVSDRDVDSLMRIEEFLKHKLTVGFLEDKDLIKDCRPMTSGDFSPGRLLDDAGGGGREPRRDNRSSGGGRGPRSGGPRGPRDNRNDGARGGERRDRRGGRDQRDQRDAREPRAEHRGGEFKPKQGQSQHSDQRSKTQHGAKPKHRHSQQPRSAQGKPQHRHTKAHPAVQKTLGSKVSGFFKKLFGG